MGELVLDRTYYAPVFFREARGSQTPDRVTLLIRRYCVTQGPKGRRRLKIDTDAKVWPSEDAMASDLLRLDWTELPDEADSNPRYVPDEVAAVLGARRWVSSHARAPPECLRRQTSRTRTEWCSRSCWRPSGG